MVGLMGMVYQAIPITNYLRCAILNIIPLRRPLFADEYRNTETSRTNLMPPMRQTMNLVKSAAYSMPMILLSFTLPISPLISNPLTHRFLQSHSTCLISLPTWMTIQSSRGICERRRRKLHEEDGARWNIEQFSRWPPSCVLPSLAFE